MADRTVLGSESRGRAWVAMTDSENPNSCQGLEERSRITQGREKGVIMEGEVFVGIDVAKDSLEVATTNGIRGVSVIHPRATKG